MDDALASLSPAEREDAGWLGDVGGSIFAVILNVQELVGATLIDESALRFPVDVRPTELSPEQLSDAASEFRDLIQSRADKNLAELGSALSRKLQGARDALEHSADGVAQAASSLVELLDRLAREAFSEAAVLEWLVDNSLDGSHYVYYTAEGRRRPTKRAQFLCLAWAGGPISQQPQTLNLQKVVALALVNVREKLQKLKHSDAGTAEERVLLLTLLNTIEGATMILARACGGAAGKQRIASLHQRLIVAKRVTVWDPPEALRASAVGSAACRRDPAEDPIEVDALDTDHLATASVGRKLAVGDATANRPGTEAKKFGRLRKAEQLGAADRVGAHDGAPFVMVCPRLASRLASVCEVRKWRARLFGVRSFQFGTVVVLPLP